MRFTPVALAGLASILAAAPAISQTNMAVPAAEATAAIPASNPKASVDSTTIGDLVDNPKTKAVLQQDMPELLTYDGLDQIRSMTMRDISKYPQANLDQARLQKIQMDLDGIANP